MCKLSSVAIGGIRFLVCCWTEDLSSVLVVGWGLPSVPSHVDISTGQLTAFPGSEQAMELEQV